MDPAIFSMGSKAFPQNGQMRPHSHSARHSPRCVADAAHTCQVTIVTKTLPNIMLNIEEQTTHSAFECQGKSSLMAVLSVYEDSFKAVVHLFPSMS